MADEDKDSKTEEPTSKRLSDSRNKGQVVSSKEVPTALLMLAALAVFLVQGNELWQALQRKMHFFLSGQISDDITPTGVSLIFNEIIRAVVMDLAPFFALFLVVAIISGLIQHGWLITFEPLMPKFSKVNPLQGLKRLFSVRSLVEAFKSIVKIFVISFAVYLAMRNNIDQILGLADTTITEFTTLMFKDSLEILWRVTLAFLLIAVLDFIYQKFDYIKGLRMSKQEIKDEMKQMEGDPLLKGRIRQIQRELAQSRMMQEVPKADVIITNPTHYACALQYTPGQMSAPKLVAKGKGLIAARIRELADENNIPRVENPPLARTLYRDVELEQFIPPELFKAVAEVLAYVFSLKNRRS
ncbi:flagellar biosynthetic protein FlhB [Magnetococcus marinus MC-1]|uniref:Flagellar biosynthetic protein FlhB n=1 Tax=Magnetococcus marinus (strain ATCC BAA-1437 / JCM 17883 / MC-1) TaxID=156889 RepID=A0L3J7_MAGMM|nr:flagellar biosynthesis protein FlhB [Magnetococcus marinus]ABK42540.1 flagellar biosynthetic protein FlhB [Magnetococcus marinus MC-1]